MGIEILDLLAIIIRVKDLYLVTLLLLKVEVDENLLDEFWIQIIVFYFSLSDDLPSVLHKFEDDTEWVRL